MRSCFGFISCIIGNAILDACIISAPLAVGIPIRDTYYEHFPPPQGHHLAQYFELKNDPAVVRYNNLQTQLAANIESLRQANQNNRQAYHEDYLKSHYELEKVVNDPKVVKYFEVTTQKIREDDIAMLWPLSIGSLVGCVIGAYIYITNSEICIPLEMPRIFKSRKRHRRCLK